MYKTSKRFKRSTYMEALYNKKYKFHANNIIEIEHCAYESLFNNLY